MRTLLRFIVLIGLMTFGAIATAAQEAPVAEPSIATGEQAINDRDIDSRIEDIFDEIEGLARVFVSVRAGVVTLRGQVGEARFAAEAEALARRVDGVVAVSDEITVETSVTERLVPVYERLQVRLLEAARYIPLLLVALLGWFLIAGAGWFFAGLKWPWDRLAPNAFIADLIRQLIRLGFVLLGAVLALDIMGATALLGTILGAAGIVGLAIGFAVRDTVENYIASILLSLRQPFMPKDFVAIAGFEGFVIRLTARATILMDVDGNHIRIPNSTVFKADITNFTRNPKRRFSFILGVDAESDLDAALEIGVKTLTTLDFTLKDPAPDAWIEEVGDSNVVITFSGWIDQTLTSFIKARSEAMRLVKLSLETEGFSLPEPIYRLRFDPGTLSTLPHTTKQTAPEKTPKQKPAPKAAPIVTNDTTVSDSVTKRVDEERSANMEDDLLNEDGADELGTR